MPTLQCHRAFFLRLSHKCGFQWVLQIFPTTTISFYTPSASIIIIFVTYMSYFLLREHKLSVLYSRTGCGTVAIGVVVKILSPWSLFFSATLRVPLFFHCWNDPRIVRLIHRVDCTSHRVITKVTGVSFFAQLLLPSHHKCPLSNLPSSPSFFLRS